MVWNFRALVGAGADDLHLANEGKAWPETATGAVNRLYKSHDWLFVALETNQR